MTVKKLFIWIIAVLALLLIGGIALERVLHDQKGNKEKAQLRALYLACKNAPADTTKKEDSIVFRDTTIYRPYPVKVEIHDSVFRQEKISWYDSVYKKDGWRIRYKLRTQGSLDYIEFSDLVAPREIITITRKIDTCINQVIKQPVFRIGPYVGLTLNSFNKFPGLEAGAQVVVSNQATLSVGGLYLDGGIYGNIRFGWILKK